MPNSLCEAYAGYYKTLDVANHWDHLLKKIFERDSFLYEDIHPLIEDCSEFPIRTADDYLKYSRDLYLLIFAAKCYLSSPSKYLDQFYPLYRKLLKYEVFRGFELAKLYHYLIRVLLEIDQDDELKADNFLKDIDLFKAGIHDPKAHLPKQGLVAEKAILLCILGNLTQSTLCLEKALMSSNWLLNLLDGKGQIFRGLWNEESDFHYPNLISSFSVMCCLSYQISSSDFHQRTYYHFLKHLQEVIKESPRISPLYPLLSKFILADSKKNSFFNKSLIAPGQNFEEINQSVGFAKYHYGNLSLALTCSGFRSGLGFLTKGDVSIVSMGPHLEPLGESRAFGIFRVPLHQERTFKDVSVSYLQDAFKFNGWSRIVNLSESDQSVIMGDSWIEVNAKAEKDNCDIEIRLEHLKDDKPVYFAFFIQADKALVNNNYLLHPKSLDRYCGDVSLVSFEKNSSKLTINSDSTAGMQLIPLAGKGFFWGADYMLAYNIKDIKKYCFTFR